MLLRGKEATLVADERGDTLATIIAGDPSWSVKDEILVGNDTDLYAVRPDGYGRTRLSGGTYHQPVWAPNGTAFAFVRGGAVLVAVATRPDGPVEAIGGDGDWSRLLGSDRHGFAVWERPDR